jgi:hypothetical protein
MLALTCDPPLPADADIRVTISEGIVSAASVWPFTTAAVNRTSSIGLPPRANSVDACRNWRTVSAPND